MEATMPRGLTLRVRLRGGFHKGFGLMLLVFSLLLSGHLTAGAQSGQEVTPLERGRAVEREIGGALQHKFQITLLEGQYASVIIEQRGIDLYVQLLGADDKPITDSDIDITTQGEERIEAVAGAAGNYILIVSVKYPKLPAGRYEVRLSEVRSATQEDRLLQESQALEIKSGQLSGAGKYAEALPVAEKVLEVEERRLGPEHPHLSYPLTRVAYINYMKGDYPKAQALTHRALAVAEKALGPEHWRVGRILHFLALFYTPVEGGEPRAEQYLQRAIGILEKALGPEHPLVATSVSELAVLYRKRGDLVRAEQSLLRTLAIHEKTLVEAHNSLASTLNSLASLYSEKGDYAKAEPLFVRALRIREKTNHTYLAAALNNLATLYLRTGEYEKAEPLYERSLSLKEKSLGPNHPEVGNSRANLAFIYYARGDYAKAEALYLSAVAIIEKARGPNHPQVGSHLTWLANVYYATGDYEKAESLNRRALAIFETARGANYSFLATILINQSKIALAQGKGDEAVAYQARANPIIEYNLALNLAIGSERQKLAYLASLPEQMSQAVSLHARFAADDTKARELAAATVLQHKGRVQDAMSASLASLRSRFSREDQALLDQLNAVTSELAQVVLNAPEGSSLAEKQKQIKSLEERRERLEVEISSRSAEFRAGSRPATLAAIRSAIPDEAALIEIAVYRPFDPKAIEAKAYGQARYVAYVVRRHGEVQWKELGQAQAIDDATREFREALRDPKRKDVEHLARTVDEKVMEPVRALVGDATHLLVSPDGALSLIPFEALVDEQGKYLVERYSFNYLTSGRDLLRLQVARNSLSNPLVLADPSFGEPEMNQIAKADTRKQIAPRPSRNRQSIIAGNDLSQVYFAPLAGTGREAQTIKSLFPEVTLLTGAEATEAGLKQVAAPRILHIATHGFFLTNELPATDTRGTRAISASAKIDNPLLRSGLALAGANLRSLNGGDGVLTALEATGLNLWGTKLVVLSACDTGVGEVKNGEGVYGLRRAFVLAGTETLVMSLWPVSDYVTRELMTAYYRNLKQGQGRGEALRQVQLTMLKRKGREHPFYWASFIQSGEWANLDGKR
jgi:CHAT domain-containing protein